MAAVPAFPPDCAQCRSPLEGYIARAVCPKCGFPQALRAWETYFDVLGVPHTFAQDRAILEKRFYEISRALHPDRFAATGGEGRLLSMERMSFLNLAYQTLRNPELLREYVLKLHGVGSPRGSQRDSRSGQIPMELAESWFELQDAVMEDPGQARKRLAEFEVQLKDLQVRGRSHLSDLEKQFDSAREKGEDVTTILEKLNKEIQSQAYLRSMERDVERMKARL